jgi:hypothetical protein
LYCCMSKLEIDVRKPWLGASGIPRDILLVQKVFLSLVTRQQSQLISDTHGKALTYDKMKVRLSARPFHCRNRGRHRVPRVGVLMSEETKASSWKKEKKDNK